MFSGAGDQQFIEAGITNHLDSYLQLDINSGYDVENDELFLGAGLALRF